MRTIFARILTRYEDVFSSITADPPPFEPCTPESPKDGNDDGHVRPGTVFFEPAQLADFPLGHHGDLRINVELLLCELQAFESIVARVGNIKAEHHIGQGGTGETDMERPRADSNLSAEAVFEALIRERIRGLGKRIRLFRDSLA